MTILTKNTPCIKAIRFFSEKFPRNEEKLIFQNIEKTVKGNENVQTEKPNHMKNYFQLGNYYFLI